MDPAKSPDVWSVGLDECLTHNVSRHKADPVVLLCLVACQVYERISGNGLPFGIYAC